jgi:hypothetical protein
MGSRLSDLDSVKRRSEVCCLSCDPCVQLEASDHVIPSEARDLLFVCFQLLLVGRRPHVTLGMTAPFFSSSLN